MNYIYAFVFLCYGQFLFSQSLKGKVVNEQNQSVEYVYIGIVGTTKGVISDEKGNFVLNISGTTPNDSLYFSHLNYHRKSLAIKDITDNSIVLIERNVELDAVVVEAKKSKIIFPISFSGGWIRVDENFEKLPLGIGISFAIKGYKVE